MTILVNPLYNPNFFDTIDQNTKLSDTVTMATFLGSYGNRCSIDHITDQETRRQLARQLYLHAEVLNTVYNNVEFNEYNIVVAESVYRAGVDEVIVPDSISAKKIDGRAVVYQLFNARGDIALSETYDLALFWKDYINYKVLSLQYDTLDPLGEPCASIVLEMPTVDNTFNPAFQDQSERFLGTVDTTLNGVNMAQGELIELLFDK